MAEASIPVDLRNPGQVFACLGLMEAAQALRPEPRGGVTGAYAWDEGADLALFTLRAPGEDDPIRLIFKFLANCVVERWKPSALSQFDVKSDASTDVISRDGAAAQLIPFPPTDGMARLPVQLRADFSSIKIEYWGDLRSAGVTEFKLWAGNVTGYSLTVDTLSAVQKMIASEPERCRAEPFAMGWPQSSSYNFDWRRTYTPLDAGFSPNRHSSRMTMVGFPVVELFAAIGLQHARPQRADAREKLAYRYAVAAAELPLVLARPVLGCADVGLAEGLTRRFRIQLGWPGQEGQARCIKDSREDCA